MKQHTVIIEKKHCIDADYGDNKNCPLAKAIKEQLPDFPLYSVGGNYIRDVEDNLWEFDDSKWKLSTMEKILNGVINNCSLIFILN